MTHTVELVKPTPEQNNRRYDEKRKTYVGESFGRGERIIMVDGVRWGRTTVTGRGCHGTVHTFQQQGGEVIGDTSTNGYFHEIDVRSQKKRWNDTGEWKPTEKRVLEKARELVAAGRLRHPDVVKREQDEGRKRVAERMRRNEEQRQQEFQERAMEATRANDPDSEIVARVVAAMEWAQTQ